MRKFNLKYRYLISDGGKLILSYRKTSIPSHLLILIRISPDITTPTGINNRNIQYATIIRYKTYDRLFKSIDLSLIIPSVVSQIRE